MFLAHRVYMDTPYFTRGHYQSHPSQPGCVADNPPRRASNLLALQNRISNGTYHFVSVFHLSVLSILNDVTTVYRIFLPPKNGLLTGSHNNQASLMLRNSFPKTQVEPSFRRISCSAAPLPRRLLLPIKQPQYKLLWEQQSRNFVTSSCGTWKCLVPFLPNSVFSSLSPPTSHSRPITIPLVPLSSRKHRGHEMPLPVLAHSSSPCASS